MRSMVTILLLAFVAATAVAHTGATGIVKERMDQMEDLKGAMKALAAMMRGKDAYDPEAVRRHAGLIADHGGEAMTRLYPEGSLDHPTEALAAIWTDWGRFNDDAETMRDYAIALAAAAGNPRSGRLEEIDRDAPRPSLQTLAAGSPEAPFMHIAASCAACHDRFREE